MINDATLSLLSPTGVLTQMKAQNLKLFGEEGYGRPFRLESYNCDSKGDVDAEIVVALIQAEAIKRVKAPRTPGMVEFEAV